MVSVALFNYLRLIRSFSPKLVEYLVSYITFLSIVSIKMIAKKRHEGKIELKTALSEEKKNHKIKAQISYLVK